MKKCLKVGFTLIVGSLAMIVGGVSVASIYINKTSDIGFIGQVEYFLFSDNNKKKDELVVNTDEYIGFIDLDNREVSLGCTIEELLGEKLDSSKLSKSNIENSLYMTEKSGGEYKKNEAYYQRVTLEEGYLDLILVNMNDTVCSLDELKVLSVEVCGTKSITCYGGIGVGKSQEYVQNSFQVSNSDESESFNCETYKSGDDFITVKYNNGCVESYLVGTTFGKYGFEQALFGEETE